MSKNIIDYYGHYVKKKEMDIVGHELVQVSEALNYVYQATL